MEEDSWWKDTFAPIIELWGWIVSILPSSIHLRRPKFNFITVHYLYILMATLVWSIMLYPVGNMAYIDALFFAAGTSTQSGLNTIDVNALTTYQQVVFMLGCCISTPVWINTAVVFVRLYWFERRFEHIVKEIRANRRTRTLSFTKSRSKSRARGEKDDDPSRLEMGVRGKPIQILKSALMKATVARSNDEGKETSEDADNKIVNQTGVEKRQSNSSGSVAEGDVGSDETVTAQDNEKEHHPILSDEPQTPQASYMGLSPRLNRGIVFADEVDTPGSPNEITRIPERQEHPELTKHIAFLERQQANKNDGPPIYIPGPRAMDRGEAPKRLDREQAMKRLHSRNSVLSHQSDELTRYRSADAPSEHSPEDSRAERGITIEEPEHPGHRATDEDDATTGRRVQSRDGLTHRRATRGIHMSDQPRSFARTLSRGTKNGGDPMPYLSWTATTGRNSTFLGLTAEQRDELGGIEYRALKTLAGILLCYFFLIHLLGLIVLLPWILRDDHYSSIVRSYGQDPAWWGIFTPASMFNDLGFTLTPNSMIDFEEATLPLLFGSFLIIIGNTGFPIFLRFIVWVLSRITLAISGPDSELYLELRFLLDHPRRCFTLLFPSKATWWLFWILVLLNGIDLIFFIVLDLNNSPVTELSGAYKVWNGWFQAVSTRTAGFASVNLAQLHAAIQVSYLVMMYISVFPIAISVRRTNVYEEKSLGIFGGEEEGDGEQSYVSQHLRRQLSFDLWYIFLGLFIIAIVEGDRIANTNQPDFTTFSVLFEIVSAYGTVGLSLGYGDTNTSFSAQFRVLSKLIIIAMMIRGRHRGLPYALDRAILLPSEKLQQKEAEESERHLEGQRRGSVFDTANNWEGGDLDESGLPRQHVVLEAMEAGAGGVMDPEGLRKMNTRRSTAMSTNSHGAKHTRSRSLSRIIAGGLSAGPTVGKQD